MAPVAVVIIIAVIQFVVIAWLVGRARHQYGIKAPATTGHEVFERWFRVQQNTLELLIVFIPAVSLFDELTHRGFFGESEPAPDGQGYVTKIQRL